MPSKKKDAKTKQLSTVPPKHLQVLNHPVGMAHSIPVPVAKGLETCTRYESGKDSCNQQGIWHEY
eukprot:11422966-Ditylum_brightwellii.AAC.1